MLKNRVFFALGIPKLEEKLEETWGDYVKVGLTSYKGGIMDGVYTSFPDVVIVNESLPGDEKIIEILTKIRTVSSDTRIIFIGRPRRKGDKFLSTLVSYGIYDFTHQERTGYREILNLLHNPRKFEDVSDYLEIPREDEYGDLHLETNIEGDTYIEEVVVQNYKEEEKPEKKGFGSLVSSFMPKKESPQREVLKEEEEIEIEEPKKMRRREEPPQREVRREPVKEPRKTRAPEPRRDFEEDYSLPNPAPTRSVRPPEVGMSQTGGMGRNRVLTFVSGKGGAGSTTVAFSVACALADEGNKVMFIEYNSLNPLIPYLLEIGKDLEGIDTCSKYINEMNFNQVQKTIVKSSLLKKEDRRKYGQIPTTLDFLFFSRAYISGAKERVELQNIKDLYIHLMFQLGYDYIILDLPSDFNSEETKAGILYCNKVYAIINQDVASIGYFIAKMQDYNQGGINTIGKIEYVLNKYVENLSVNKKYVSNWLGLKPGDINIVPDVYKSLVDCNLRGDIALFKNRDLESAIKQIVENIKR